MKKLSILKGELRFYLYQLSELPPWHLNIPIIELKIEKVRAKIAKLENIENIENNGKSKK